MNILIERCKKKLGFSKKRGVTACLMLLALLFSETACQPNSANSATETVPETQPPAATATSLPPTATPEPEPVDDRVQNNVPYRDFDQTAPTRVVDIYLPEINEAPYPTIFMLPGLDYQPLHYTNLANQFVERGYAVVVVKYRTFNSREPYHSLGEEDVYCAFAWLMDNTAVYELDPQHIFVFEHTFGGLLGSALPLVDEVSWPDKMPDCPNPFPDTTAIKAVITYDAMFGLLEGTLGRFSRLFAPYWGVPILDINAAIAALQKVPPQDWPASELLDDNARNLASMLPLYWMYKAVAEQAVIPPYLLIYDSETSGGVGINYVVEAESMAEHMQTAGVDVTLQLLTDAQDSDLVSSQSTVPAQVVDLTDAFIRGLSE